jgi:hypothetical protein
VGGNPLSLIDPTGLYFLRQDWQPAGAVGRPDSLVEPRGVISEFIETVVPGGYSFGVNHDAFVDNATRHGAPDWLVNIPSMPFVYFGSLLLEFARAIGIAPQPQLQSGAPQLPPC